MKKQYQKVETNRRKGEELSYREDLTYQALERIITQAGVKVEYMPVPDDHIDGAIWARADQEARKIMMPDDGNAFPDEETACLILGHEMGHILSGLDSPDDVVERKKNEAVCDLIGAYLTKLAEMTAGTAIERALFEE